MNGDYKSMTSFSITLFSRATSSSLANSLIVRHVHSVVNFLSDIYCFVAVVNETLSCLFEMALVLTLIILCRSQFRFVS